MEDRRDRAPSPLQRHRKRTHDHIFGEGARTPAVYPWTSDVPQPILPEHPPPAFDDPHPPTRRQYRDGFDCRRPAMSSTLPFTADVIDLTHDSNPPPLRHPVSQHTNPTTANSINHAMPSGREVINLEDNDDEEESETIDLLQDEDGINETPDVEVLYSMSLPAASTPPFWGGGHPRPPRIRPMATQRVSAASSSGWALPGLRDLPHLLDYLHRAPGGITPEQGTVLRAERSERRAPYRPRRQFSFIEHNNPSELVISDGITRQSFRLPGTLDFESQAFELGTRDDVNPIAPDPVYAAPPPARPGYTRSPREDDIAVCSNCDDELGTGDSDLKRQVWFIKKCGHVYCGDCTKYRTRTLKARDSKSPRPKPFSCCVVDGCGKIKIGTQKAMLQLYI